MGWEGGRKKAKKGENTRVKKPERHGGTRGGGRREQAEAGPTSRKCYVE